MSNGIIINYGVSTQKGTAGYKVTFPTPFTTTNYSLILQQQRDSGISATYVNGQAFNQKTTTYANVYRGYSEESIINWIAIGY